ncbi:nucleotidyltransferase domain-containing protein [Clostridium aestuarii]|uniref:Nucleotidyltransferase domain-containing protein n=1 Tax=Clostridium aestuarii TaxID=338193 RepID=A0ABT4CV59_9CLOT|nr:nucleotidyltransferase domain-containing protein [Clostridium aestuarii]MCY6482851.1 nucleotidyltransferase domain-containing protein [Clostridium aestuarii]
MILDSYDVNKINGFLIDNTKPYLVMVSGNVEHRETGDKENLDVGFISDKHYNVFETFMLSQELGEILHVDVQVVDLEKCTEEYKKEMKENGKIIYCSN